MADIAAKHSQDRINETTTLDILPWFLALAFGRAWLTLTYASPHVALPGLVPLHYTLFDLVYCAVSVIAVIAAHTIAPLCERRWARGAALACMLAASACCICVMGMAPEQAASQTAGALTSAGAVLAGAGFALLLLLWAEVLSTLSMRRIVMQLASAQILALVILFFCQGLDPLRLGVAIVALPLIAIHSIGRAWHSTPATARPQRTDVRFTFPWAD